MASAPDYYTILGIAPSSEDVVVQAAYRALMRRYHPDTSSFPDAAARARLINEAYSVLGDRSKRAEYDRKAKSQSRARQQSAAPPPPPPRSSNRGSTGGSDQTFSLSPEYKKFALDLRDTLLLVIKIIFAVIVCLIVLGLGLAAYEKWDEWFPLEDKVTASVAVSAERCPGDQLLVTLTNESGVQVISTHVRISVLQGGYSSVLSSFDSYDDKIIEPAEIYEICLSPTDDYTAREWSSAGFYSPEMLHEIEVLEAGQR